MCCSTFGALAGQKVVKMSSTIYAKTGIGKSSFRGSTSPRKYPRLLPGGGVGRKEEKKKRRRKEGRKEGRYVERRSGPHARPGGSADKYISRAPPYPPTL